MISRTVELMTEPAVVREVSGDIGDIGEQDRRMKLHAASDQLMNTMSRGAPQAFWEAAPLPTD